MSARPTTASLRRLLERVLITDSAFEAFCLDYFPAVAQHFANGNDRVQKLSLLLRLSDGQKILSNLREAHPRAVAEHEALLVYAASYAERVGRPGLALLLGGLAAATGLAALGGVWHHARTSTLTTPVIDKAADGGVKDLPSSAAEASAADDSHAHVAASTLPTALPLLKIVTPRQRKDAAKLTAPLSSVEKFFQNAIDLGPAAELVTYKKIDPAQRQWITHVVLVDGRNRQPVSMIVYSEAQYKAWSTDLGGIGELFRSTLVKIEAALSVLPEYRISSEEILLQRTKDAMESAWYDYRFQFYARAMKTAKAIAQAPGETVNNRLEAWRIVGLSSCKGRLPGNQEATQQYIRLQPALKGKLRSLCQ